MQGTNKDILTYHIYMTVIPSHCCQETPIGQLYAEKTAEAVLLYVYDIVFPAPLFKIIVSLKQVREARLQCPRL